METAIRTLQHTLLGNTYWEWLIACVISVVCAATALFGRRLARGHYRRLAATEAVERLEIPLQVVGRTASLFIALVALVAGLSSVELPRKFDRVVVSALTIGLFLQFGVWGTTALVGWLEQRRRTALETDRAAIGSLGIIGFVLRVVIWGLVLLLTLDNLGIDVTTLVAGLGVGGIAVALAVQNVLGDLFASLSITLDKPFVIGDFLIVGDFMGSVEHIGIKSVRLRSLSGEQIIMANTDLLKSRVRNYGRMAERRVIFTLGVTYETPRETLRRIPELIQQAITREDGTRFDRSHFAKFADFSLDFESVYYVLSADFNRHMDVQQRIYLSIHEAFERAGIEFAYPTRKLWVTSLPATLERAESADTPPGGDRAAVPRARGPRATSG